MDSATRGHHIADLEHLKEYLCALIASVEAEMQELQDHPTRTTGSDSMSVNTGDDVEPLTATRINEIVQHVPSKVATWAELREQYPPGQSCLAPLNIPLSAKEAVASTGVIDLDAILAVDSAYCQAATMAAYGNELLSIALYGAQVSRRRVEQASDIFAKLCATLSDSHNRHRDLVIKILAEKRSTSRHEQDASRELEPRSPLGSGGVAPIELPMQNVGPISRQWARDVRKLRTSLRHHPYCRERGHLEASAQQLPGCGATQAVDSTTCSHLHSRLPSSNDSRNSSEGVVDEPIAATPTMLSDPNDKYGVDEPSVTDSPAKFVAWLKANGCKLPEELSRRNIIRNGLLRQGYSVPDITNYLKLYSERTNENYDCMWRCWAIWCVARDTDPCKASDKDLDIYVSKADWNKSWRIQTRNLVKLVWSIVEGHPPPPKGKSL